MNNDILDLSSCFTGILETPENQPDTLNIVRVSTCYYNNGTGLSMRKDIKFLKRRSGKEAYNMLTEESSNVGDEWAFKMIVNIMDVDDGLYSLGVTNISRDWESGHVDGYDLKLFPYMDEK